MWPKALAQLVELAPHIVRMVPMADRFFQSKTASEDASRGAMEAMAAGLRGDLGQVTAAHAGLYKQLTDQAELITAVGVEARAARVAIESVETRISHMEQRLAKTSTLLSVTIGLNVVLLALTVFLLVRH